MHASSFAPSSFCSLVRNQIFIQNVLLSVNIAIIIIIHLFFFFLIELFLSFWIIFLSYWKKPKKKIISTFNYNSIILAKFSFLHITFKSFSIIYFLLCDVYVLFCI